MRTINITRYKPYEHIILSHNVILNALNENNAIYNSGLIVFKKQTIKQSRQEKRARPILVFGELERVLSMQM